MTERRSIAALGIWLLAGVMLGAATEIWDKPFNTWTDMELKQMLSGSPWAGKGSISRVRQNGAGAQTLDEVVLITWSSALPMRQAAARQQMTAGTAVPADVEAQLAKPTDMYTITVKVSDGNNPTTYARTVTQSQPETFLLRDGKPPLAAAKAEGRILDKEGKPVEMPAGGPRGGGGGAPRGGGAVPQNGPLFSVQGGGGGFGGGGGRGGGGGVQGGSALLVFSFPKSEAITLADKEVEFVSKLCSQSFGGFGGGGGGGAVPQNGPLFSMQGGGGGGRGGQAGGANATPACNLTIKKKFKLKDMAVKGEPAL